MDKTAGISALVGNLADRTALCAEAGDPGSVHRNTRAPERLTFCSGVAKAGANALGAMLGASAAGLSRPARIALLAGIAGLTAASEKVSFTKVIERTPALRRLDMLGRRPANQVPDPAPPDE